MTKAGKEMGSDSVAAASSADVGPKPTPTCGQCRFFVLQQPSHTFGDCHRSPPQFDFTVNIQRDTYTDRGDKISVSRFPNARWPNLSMDEFCGEFQEKNQ